MPATPPVASSRFPRSFWVILLALLPCSLLLWSPLLLDERLMAYEARKWIGLDPLSPWHQPLGGSGTWRPLLVFLYWADAGLDPVFRRLTNLLLHGLFVWLAFRWLCLRLSPEGALFAGVFLAIHPSHVACAGWVAGRADLAMGCLAVLALHAWDRERMRSALLFGVLAVLVKETGVALVPMFWLIRRDRRGIPVFLVLVAVFGLSLVLSEPGEGYMPSLGGLLEVAVWWPVFLVELLVPWFHPLALPGPVAVLGLLGSGAAFLLLVWRGRKLPGFGLGLGLAVSALLPVLHVLPNDGGQWYLLLPSLGASLALGALFDRRRRTVPWFAGLLLAGLVTAQQVAGWHEAAERVERLLESGVEVPPQDPRDWPHLGPSFCCGVPYQVRAGLEPGWGPVSED